MKTDRDQAFIAEASNKTCQRKGQAMEVIACWAFSLESCHNKSAEPNRIAGNLAQRLKQLKTTTSEARQKRGCFACSLELIH